MTAHLNNQKTVEQVLGMLSGGKWINRNTRVNCLPPRGQIVALLAERGVVSQTTGKVVTDDDWRDQNYGMSYPRHCLYVMLHYHPRERVPSVHAVFDYEDNSFSYC